MHAIEHDWPRIERLQQRLLEHARQGAWRDDLALKATRRTIANTDSDGSWGRLERDTAALMLLEHITRPDPQPTRTSGTAPIPDAPHPAADGTPATPDGTDTGTGETRRPTPFRSWSNACSPTTTAAGRTAGTTPYAERRTHNG